MLKNILSVFAIATLVLLSQCSDQEPVSGTNSIIPKPGSKQDGEGSFIINRKTSIEVKGDAKALGVANYFVSLINASSAFELMVSKGTAAEGRNVIVFELKDGIKNEGYHLDISTDKIIIQAGDAAGLFYGVQSLRQLLSVEIEARKKIVETWKVNNVSIHDEPKYSWRGMHLDVSRHFFSVTFLKEFIDRLALYKFNTFHLHLTDDQGWRIEIKKYPQLTESGAWRIYNNQDSVCLNRAVDDPDFALPGEFVKKDGGRTVYGGYYTQEQIKEIVAYAAERFVTIVPEIDMPGHMKSVLNSYPELSCVDGTGWGKLFSIPLCPCEETTYSFMENVLGEIVELFPGQYVHIGADEVDRSTWAQSILCKELMKKEGFKDPAELQGYFVRRMEKFLNSKGKKMIGWDEVLDGGVDSTTTVMYWRGWIPDAPSKAIGLGHNVIMSPTSHCYFDYVPDNTTLEHVYTFNPVPGSLNTPGQNKIIGLQANIWTEWIPTTSRLDYMTMPRMIALAEVAWSTERNFNDFNKRLADHYARLDLLGIKFRLPDIPNLKEHVVFLQDEELNLIKPEGVSEIRYTTDGSLPDNKSTLYEGSIKIDSSTTFKIMTFGYHGRRGNVYTVKFDKQEYLTAIAGEFKPGINCSYFEGNFSSVNQIPEAGPKKKIISPKIELPDNIREDNFGLRFKGFIEVPSDGIYTFFLSSDDGSVLSVGDRIVIDNDGFRGAKEVSGQIALRKGMHPLFLEYFEASGGNSIHLSMEGPGIVKQEVSGPFLWNQP